MELGFEWDEGKALENYRKHKVKFEEGVEVFSDPFSITISDPDHSINEQRYIDIGASAKGHILVVSYTERNRKIRIISCHKALRIERRKYEEGIR
jgi:uncharacterized DUF497 family protein